MRVGILNLTKATFEHQMWLEAICPCCTGNGQEYSWYKNIGFFIGSAGCNQMIVTRSTPKVGCPKLVQSNILEYSSANSFPRHIVSSFIYSLP